ncbi:hypothetical protein H5410_003367, partial [Solanum commersonii]
EIANQLDDPPFGQLHRLFTLTFSILKFYNFGRSNNCITKPFGDTSTALFSRQLDFLLRSLACNSHSMPCSFLPISVHALFLNPNTWKSRILHHKPQVQHFRKDVSNRTTQDSIMNAHKKTQLTHARINCAPKDSSCDSPLSKILKFTILA